MISCSNKYIKKQNVFFFFLIGSSKIPEKNSIISQEIVYFEMKKLDTKMHKKNNVNVP